MKLTWNQNNTKKRPLTRRPNLPFEQADSTTQQDLRNDPQNNNTKDNPQRIDQNQGADRINLDMDSKKLAESFQAQGNKFAEDGNYGEALGKWEAALMLTPENAVLYEQKAQILLEIGNPWKAVMAATRAVELEPSWAEAWVTLGRAQLNFGEPDCAVESFDKALAIKSDLEEAKEDRQNALNHVKKRKQLHESGKTTDRSRFEVGD